MNSVGATQSVLSREPSGFSSDAEVDFHPLDETVLKEGTHLSVDIRSIGCGPDLAVPTDLGIEKRARHDREALVLPVAE